MSDPERKKSFLSIFEQISKNHIPQHQQNGHPYSFDHQSTGQEDPNDEEENYDPSYILSDEIDHQILMHRDAHFGGDFNVMLSYYSNDEHIGINPDFDIERIAYLSEIEKEIGQDLAPLFLTGAEAEAVGHARQMYSQLKEIYEIENKSNLFPDLIADLILSEIEEPIKEIEAIVSQGTAIVPELLALLKSDDLYDPLFPGYGYAPYLAILCLGKIKDPKSIIPIFETLSKQIIFDEAIVIEALVNIGEPAKEFLLQVLKSRPLTQDNPNAAFVLISFPGDPKIAVICFEQLQDPEVQEKPLLTTYLTCGCQFLNTSFYRDAFTKMANDPNTLATLREEMQYIINEWK